MSFKRFLALMLFAFISLQIPAQIASAQSDGASSEAAPQSAWPSPAQQADKPKPAFGARPFGAPPTVAPTAPPQAQSGWWRTIMDMQQNFFRRMGSALKDFKQSGTLAASWALITVSFLYGIFHAAGPGHGKAVISAYVVASGASLRRGVILSFLAAIVQALSAISIITVLAVMLNAAGLQIRTIAQHFELVSSALITLAGIWLLSAYIWRRFLAHAQEPALAHAGAGAGGHHHDHHHHDENCGCGHAHMPDPGDLEKDWSLGKAAAIVFAVGIRPCSGAIFILIFALTQGLYWAGIVSTFAMALGTAITVSILATAAALFRDATLHYASSRWTNTLYDIAAIAGSCLVIFFGLGLFLASLGPARPF